MMARLTHILLFVFLLGLSAAAHDHIPNQSAVIVGVDRDSMERRLYERPLQPIEGVWQYPAEGMTLGVEQCTVGNLAGYRLIMLESDDVSLLPGTVIGYARQSVVDGKYQLWLYCERDRTTLRHPLECVATLSGDHSTLTFDPPKWRVKVRMNLARFLPRLFPSVSITPHKDEERLPEGFKKVYSTSGESKSSKRKIRYL